MRAFESMRTVYFESGGGAASRLLTPLVTSPEEIKGLKTSQAYDQLLKRTVEHMVRFYTHETGWQRAHQFDIGRLWQHRSKLVLSKGSISYLALQVLPVAELSRLLEIPVMQLPGSHLPLSTHRDEFVRDLLDILLAHSRELKHVRHLDELRNEHTRSDTSCGSVNPSYSVE